MSRTLKIYSIFLLIFSSHSYIHSVDNIGMIQGDAVSDFGFEVENITPEMAQNLDIMNNKGVVISNVRRGSPAAEAGMKKGALVVEANQQKIMTTEEFYHILNVSEEGRPVLLLIKQDGQLKFLSMRVH